VHHAANSVVEHQQAVEFLANEIWCSAAQDDSRAAQMGFEFIKRGLDFPSLMVESRPFFCRGSFGIEDCCQKPVDIFSAVNAIETIVDDADRNALGFMAPLLLGWIDMADVRSIWQGSSTFNRAFF